MELKPNRIADKPFIWFPELPPLKTQIWRYINLFQLISIFERQALWFYRADKLDDPLEGNLTEESIKELEDNVSEIDFPNKHGERLEGITDENHSLVGYQYKKIRDSTYVNSWHMGDYESAAMWEFYSKIDRGLAIQTTIRNLIEALGCDIHRWYGEKDELEESTDKHINIGKVNYIDYHREEIPLHGVLGPIYHKRKEFDYEKEFRVTHTDISTAIGFSEEERETLMEEGRKVENLDTPDLPNGKYIQIDHNSLIENLYISPTSSNPFIDLIQMVVSSYDIDCGVEKTDLGDFRLFW